MIQVNARYRNADGELTWTDAISHALCACEHGLALIESEPYRDAYRLRFSNYGAAILHAVFDIRKWIYEARVLKWRAQESPWLVSGAGS